MKHLIASIIASVSLVIPYFIAFVFWNWHGIKDIGMSMVLVTSIVFSFIPICIWGLVSLLTVKILNKPIIKENTIEFNEYVKGWEHNIAVSCFAHILLSFVFLYISIHFNLGFKWFCILTYLFPLIRLIITFLESIKSKK